jgi:para-aminobenzoate synthetase/4-amino-4-deoxychorismate lyase
MAPGEVRAAFDVPLDPRDRSERLRGLFRGPPDRVLRADSPAGVPAVVAAARDAAAAGSWVVGGLAYEAGGVWEPAQATLPPVTPLAWFEVFGREPEPWPAHPGADPGTDGPGWFPSGGFRAAGPEAAVAAVQGHIAAGDCYQVNLTGRVTARADGPLWHLANRLDAAQPGGYTVFLAEPGIASVSPELFFQRRADGTVLTQPMKGTAPADAPGRLAEPKERAENLMIVDLLRNDLGRVCVPGTVGVPALFELVRLPTLWQLVSTVSGRLRPGLGLVEVLAALFPCGSVTGAPRIRAMAVIAELEATARGWYCGTLMVLRPGGEAIASVAIRTVEQRGDWWHCGVGSGVVADSVPAAELAEWRAKARFLGGPATEALETLLLVDGGFPRGPAHLARLARCSDDLGLGVDPAAVRDELARVAHAHPTGRHRVRLVASAAGARAEVAPLPSEVLPLVLAVAAEPLAVDVLGPVIAHKTTRREHYDRLLAQAPPGVFDVICHDPDGRLTECTRGNLALEIDGRWLTPSAGAGLLPGTLRAELLAAGTLEEAELWLADLDRASGLAFLNGTRGWCPAVLLTPGSRSRMYLTLPNVRERE